MRTAVIADARDILDIYAPFVLTTAISFERELPSLEQMEKRIEACLEKFPWLVITHEGRITGYAYASRHREREAYQWSCECSVYVHENYRGKGIAAELYRVLLEVLKLQGIRNAYAGITLPNESSVRLHEKCGFEPFAIYENVGYKLNSWQKVGWWRLRLNDFTPEPAPPLEFYLLDRNKLEMLFHESIQRINSKFI